MKNILLRTQNRPLPNKKEVHLMCVQFLEQLRHVRVYVDPSSRELH